MNPPCLIPVFISAALVLRNSKFLKEVRDTDIATMHQALAHLPAHEDSMEDWLKSSLRLMKAYKGREGPLMTRAVEVKNLQNQLWNEDSNNNRRRSRRQNRENEGVIASVGRFIFVKYRWYTVAVVALGAAFLIQSKYGNGDFTQFESGFKSAVEKYVPDCFKSLYKTLVGAIEFE